MTKTKKQKLRALDGKLEENDMILSEAHKMPVDLQSFPETINESLEEGFIMGNGLEYISICSHVANSPLAQSCAAQSEDVTEKRGKF